MRRFAVLTLLTLALAGTAYADQAAVFYGGLCVTGRPDSCAANANAEKVFASKLPADTQLVIAGTVDGRLPNGTSELVRSICSKQKITLIAFSAGYIGLNDTVQAMPAECRKKVATIVSLESNYPGFQQAQQIIRAANPNVNVQFFNASQFNTSHDLMPASPGIANAVGKLMGEETAGTANVLNLSASQTQATPPVTAPSTNLAQQTLQNVFRSPQPSVPSPVYSSAAPSSAPSPAYAQAQPSLMYYAQSSPTLPPTYAPAPNTSLLFVPTAPSTALAPLPLPNPTQRPTSTPLILASFGTQTSPVQTRFLPTMTILSTGATTQPRPQTVGSGAGQGSSFGAGSDQLLQVMKQTLTDLLNFFSTAYRSR